MGKLSRLFSLFVLGCTFRAQSPPPKKKDRSARSFWPHTRKLHPCCLHKCRFLLSCHLLPLERTLPLPLCSLPNLPPQFILPNLQIHSLFTVHTMVNQQRKRELSAFPNRLSVEK